MKLPKKLLAAASDDPTRPCLTVAHIDPERRRIVVCNGKVLVAHPIPGDAEPKPGCITPETWKAITKGAKSLDYDPETGTVNGADIDTAELRGPYPNYGQVIPEFDPAYRIGINVRLLAEVADSMGTDHVHLEFAGENRPTPILVKADLENPGAAFGVLMPMNPAKEKVHHFGLLTGQCERSQSAAPDDAAMTDLRRQLAAERRKSADLSTQLIAATADLNGLRESIAAAHSTVPLKREPEKAPVPAATAPPVLSRNAERNGIELRFNGKPDDATRDAMKARGFRWLPGKPGQPWAARYSEEALVLATALAESRPVNIVPMPAPPVPDAPAAKVAGDDLPDLW